MIAKILSPMSALATGLVLAGCAATQSPGFRKMSAIDHEHAAQYGADATGATSSEHREAAQQLREAEHLACAEVPDADRDLGPFARRDRIVGIEAVRDRVYPKASPQLFGVNVTIRATPGVTEQWIGRVIDCHVAHYAVVGVDVAPPPSPVLVHGATVQVFSTADGFRVSITSKDIDVAREVLRAGRALVATAS